VIFLFFPLLKLNLEGSRSILYSYITNLYKLYAHTYNTTRYKRSGLQTTITTMTTHEYTVRTYRETTVKAENKEQALQKALEDPEMQIGSDGATVNGEEMQ